MTDALEDVVVPYARFLERRERRQRIAAELMRRDRPRTIDPEVRAVEAVKPLANQQPCRNDPCRVKRGELTT